MVGSKSLVGLLDYGAGNLGSVARAVSSLGYQFKLIRTRIEMDSVDHLIFPGVGSAKQAMVSLDQLKLIEPLKEYAANGRPLLGICVGMQVLGQWSEEGNVECLGLFPYRIEKFKCDGPIPHMGWNSVHWNTHHPSFAGSAHGLTDLANFYFVHSYAAFNSQEDVTPTFALAETSYSGLKFHNFVANKNVWGSQCHIEKSGRAGLQFIENFLMMSGDGHA